MILNPTQTANYFRHGVITLSTALAVVLMLAIPASAEEINFSPGQVAAGQNIGEFEISPDGTKVVFSGSLDNTFTPGQQTYVAGVLSGVANPATRVDPTNAGDNDGGVKWTPDGLSVITRYDLGGGNANEIYRLPADGSQVAQQLSFNSGNAFDPKVSSDGSRFFYSDGGSLFTSPIAGASAASAIRLNPGNANGEISEIDTGTYSLSGSNVYFSGFSTPVPGATNSTREDTFYRTAADGSTANAPTNILINNMPTDTTLNFNRFEVTPDGQRIIFQGDMTTNGQEELFGISTAGGDFVSLFAPPRADFDVNFFKISHDGSMIAFVSDYLTNGVGEPFIVSTAGGTPRRVSDSAHFTAANGLDVAFTGDPDRLQFSPDDQFLYYVADGGSGGDHDGIFTLHRVSTAVAVPEPAALPLLFAATAVFLRRKRS